MVIYIQQQIQLFPWLVWDTGSNVFASASYNQRNDLTTLNTNLPKFPLDGEFNVRAFINGDGTTNTQLDSLTLFYYTGSGGTTPAAETDFYLRNLTLTHLGGPLL